MIKRFRSIGRLVLLFFILLLLLANSGLPSNKFSEKVRVQTRWIEFDFVNWTLDALFTKLAQSALGTHRYLDFNQQAQIIQDQLDMVIEHRQLKETINQIYADPSIKDPERAAHELLIRQRRLQNELTKVGLLSEAVLQQQISQVLKQNQLTFLGQPIPPVQYHSTALPYALIVSPRDVIRQDADISLLPQLTLDEITALEQNVENELNVSALVVPVGGVGVYPTMVMETSNFPWLAEVVSHEWTHNYLTWHPLGMLYMETPALRIINETTASIVGKEIGGAALELYYPQYSTEVPPVLKNARPVPVVESEDFDFRAEMRETRVKVDALLAEGKIEEAESYMDNRRALFVDHGYNIRRLNQAYFAFYGAYADQPGGAAGEDPVGAAVRQFRAESESLSAFLKRIAWVTSYEALLRRLSVE
ncbi:MAG: hypothetical protein CL609_14770 [Anaerolineaceae bacterium]|nr:hypothetical protein [Anaerolineaceae bacterium]